MLMGCAQMISDFAEIRISFSGQLRPESLPKSRRYNLPWDHVMLDIVSSWRSGSSFLQRSIVARAVASSAI